MLDKIAVEVWWWLEQHAGRFWNALSRDRASYWFDPVPAYFYRKRKNAEHRVYSRRSAA